MVLPVGSQEPAALAVLRSVPRLTDANAVGSVTTTLAHVSS